MSGVDGGIAYKQQGYVKDVALVHVALFQYCPAGIVGTFF